MELNADLVSIQGILSSKLKEIGEFTNINYRGGKYNLQCSSINFFVVRR